MPKNKKDLFVTKRNGATEPFNIDKIHLVVKNACDGLNGVSVSDVEMNASLEFYPGIKTTEIHNALTKAATALISETAPNYQYVAGRLLMFNIRKTAWGGGTPPRLYDHIRKMVERGYYTRDLLDYYTEEDWDIFDNYIDHDKDLSMSYIAVKEFSVKYAFRDRTLKDITPLETPQITFILAAALLAGDTKSRKDVKRMYDELSNGNWSLPTPIMAGLRTNIKQYSSCVKIETGDSLDSINETTSSIVNYVSKKAGIGINASAIRAENSKIRDGSTKHTGTLPFFRLFESAVKSCSQGGVRGGSATLHYLVWHKDVMDMLPLKNNKGTPDSRVRRLDYSVVIPHLFYRKYINNEDVTLFSPHEVRDMYDAMYTDPKKFEELYDKYAKSKSVAKTVIPAKDLFDELIKERAASGRLYIFNVDNVNQQTCFKEPIRMSNLCQEITLVTEELGSTKTYSIFVGRESLADVLEWLGNSDIIKSFEIKGEVQ